MTHAPERPLPVDQHDDCVHHGGDGSEEVAVAPMSFLLRGRAGVVRERVEASDRHAWLVLAAVLGGLLSVNFTFTLFAVARQRVQTDLHTDAAGVTLAITLPLLAFGIAAPAMGKLGDRFGHRRLYLIGMGGSGLAAVASAVATNAAMLTAVRTVGSMLGAATGAASMAIIFSVFGRDERVKAMGWWSLIGAGGPVIGVVVGGPVIESFGWRAMFWAQAPLTLVATVIAVIVLPEVGGRALGAGLGRRRFDIAGAATLALSVTTLLLALNRGPSLGWTSPFVLLGFALSPLFGVAFFLVERRAEEPVLPLAFLRRRNFSLPMGAQAFGNFAYMGGFILAPKLLHDVYGFGESKTGLVSIARPLTFSILAPVAGYLAVRIGERVASVAGNALIVASMVAFASLSAGSHLAPIMFALALSGAGMGIASPSLTASVANEVDEANMGSASAALQLVNQVGLVAGIQIMSTLQESRVGPDGLVGSFRDAYILGGVVCILAVVCSAFVRRTPRQPAPVTAPAPAVTAAAGPLPA